MLENTPTTEKETSAVDCVIVILDRASTNGWQWRGVWNKLSYSAKELNAKSILEKESYKEFVNDRDFLNAVFGKVLHEDLITMIQESNNPIVTMFVAIVGQGLTNALFGKSK